MVTNSKKLNKIFINFEKKWIKSGIKFTLSYK